MNRQIRLKSRPAGMPTTDNFEAVDAPVPSPGDGEVLRRTLFLSLDPYMRGRMSDAPSYAPPVNLGDVMCGHTVSEVVDSRHPAFAAGDIVAAYDGWQQFASGPAKDVRKLDAGDGEDEGKISIPPGHQKMAAERAGSRWTQRPASRRDCQAGTSRKVRKGLRTARISTRWG